MRGIKFRGYDTDSKVWRYGSYFYKEDRTLSPVYNSEVKWEQDMKANGHHLILWNGSSDWNLPKPHYQSEVDEESIGQFTGLHDKNGNEIYEGDIVEAWSEGVKAIGEVKRRTDGLFIIYPAYQRGEFWGLCPDVHGHTTVEVIGNIYENPELLGE